MEIIKAGKSPSKEFISKRTAHTKVTTLAHQEKDAPYIDRKSFAVFEKLKKGEDQYKHLCIYQNIHGNRCLDLLIVEKNMEKKEE